MKIIFDGKEFEVDNKSDNIVEVAEKNGTFISAPCFRNNKKDGCCNGCLIMVDGKEQFACATKPYDGMNIIYNTEVLEKKRKEKLLIYAEHKKSGKCSENTCNQKDNSEKDQSCGCGEKGDCCK